MGDYQACTVGQLRAALSHAPDDAVLMIPSEVAGVLVPLGRVLLGGHVGQAIDELAENVFDGETMTQSAVCLLPADDDEIVPAGDAVPNYTL